MALTEKDLAIAIQRLKERNAQQAKPTERISYLDMRERATAGPSVSGDALTQQSQQVLEKQEQVADSVTKPDGNGLNANIINFGKDMKSMSNNMAKLVTLTSEQVNSLKDFADKQTDTVGPLEKIGQFFGKIKTAIINPKQFALETLNKTMGDVPIVGSLVKKKLEQERDVRNLVRTGMSEDEARDRAPKVRSARRAFREKDEEYQAQLKESGLSAEQFNKLPGAKKLVEERNAAAQGWTDVDPTAAAFIGKEKSSTRKDKTKIDSADNLKESKEYSDEQIELLREIAENTRPSRVAGGAKAKAVPTAAGKPKTGKEVDFSGQKYRFLGQQWAEVDSKTGKTGRMAERGIVGELNKRAGVPAVGKEPTKAPAMSLGGKIKDISNNMIGAAKGVAAMGAALVVLSFGLKSMSSIDMESIAKTAVALGGLAITGKLMGDNVGSMLKGALGIAALGAALLVAGEAFKTFAELDWEALARAGVALGGLALAAAGIGAFIAPILAGAAAIAAIGGSVWLLAKGIDALAGAIDKIKSPKAATKAAGGVEPVEPQTAASKAAPAASAATATGGERPIEGNIQATQTGPGKYEGVSSGITSDDITNHPKYNEYYEKSLGGRKGPDAERMARRSARMKVERDMMKQAAAGKQPTTGVDPVQTAEGKSPGALAQQAADQITGKKTTDAANVVAAPVQTANKVYGASAENASAAVTAGGAGTTTNVVAPTTVTNTTNQINSYKPDVRNQDSSFRRMLDARYVPV